MEKKIRKQESVSMSTYKREKRNKSPLVLVSFLGSSKKKIFARQFLANGVRLHTVVTFLCGMSRKHSFFLNFLCGGLWVRAQRLVLFLHAKVDFFPLQNVASKFIGEEKSNVKRSKSKVKKFS